MKRTFAHLRTLSKAIRPVGFFSSNRIPQMILQRLLEKLNRLVRFHGVAWKSVINKNLAEHRPLDVILVVVCSYANELPLRPAVTRQPKKELFQTEHRSSA